MRTDVTTHPQVIPEISSPPVIGALFIEVLRRSWRQLIYWGIGFFAMALMMLLIIPDAEFLQAYQKIAEMFPDFWAAFAGEDAAFAATPEGYLAAEFFSWIVIVYGVYAMVSAAKVTLNDELSGSLDIELSLPVRRSQLIIEKTLAYALMLIGLVFMSFLGFWVGEMMVDVLTIDMIHIAETVFIMLPPSLLVLTFTVCMSAILRTRASIAWVGAVLIIGGYILELIGRMASGSIFEWLSNFSFYHYYRPIDVIQFGINWGDMAVLLGAALALLVLALYLFDRRDVAV